MRSYHQQPTSYLIVFDKISAQNSSLCQPINHADRPENIPMRITYLHQYFNTSDMSGGTRSYELARQLVGMGHEVNMITSRRDDDGGNDWYESEEDGIRVHWLPVPYSNRMGFAGRIRAFLRFAWGAARKAASLQTDVVFATSTPLTIALPGAYAARVRRVPMVFEIRDLWPDVPVAMGVLKSRLLVWIARRLEQFAYRQATAIVALTPTMRDFVSGKGVSLGKIAVIPNGANLERFAESVSKRSATESTERPKTLLYCGSLGPAHGPEYLVSLAEEFKRQSAGIRILVAGDGGLRKHLEEQARGTKCLDQTISFVGSIPLREVPEYYWRADASLMTMADCELLFRHSVQNKFFDSLAAGKPVFSNYSGWSSELSERIGVGAILPRDDAALATEILTEKLQDQNWLDAAGQSARKLAEDRFGYERLGKQLEAVLLSATGSNLAAIGCATL